MTSESNGHATGSWTMGEKIAMGLLIVSMIAGFGLTIFAPV
jgi:hypothetical protein